jgi:hypothetical protein
MLTLQPQKQIPLHKHIVEFRAAGVNQQDRGSGAEILILMEFCPGKPISNFEWIS